jgi:hypothetical protein
MKKPAPVVTRAAVRRLLQAHLLVSAVLIPGSLRASVVTVPDDYTTIQAAIDVGADTVFVREGEYAEVPQAYRGVALLGLGPTRPRIAGLTISNPYGWLSRKWRISAIDVAGPVLMHTGNPHARLLDIAFDRCRLAEGLVHDAGDPIDIDTLSLTHCMLEGQSDGRAVFLRMYSDTSTAGWSWNVEGFATVDSCWFSGGVNQALRVGGNDQASASIVGNVIEYAPKGLALFGFGDATIRSNVVRHASAIGMALDAWRVQLQDNEISDCGIGLYRYQADATTLIGNKILRTANTGAQFRVQRDLLRVERNVIGNCGGSAVAVLQYAPSASIRFDQNTLYDAAGSGILIVEAESAALTVTGNVGFGIEAFGLQVVSSSFRSATLGCNDWFANGLGAVSGMAVSATDVAVDPGFCDVANDDVSLYSDSPLLSQAQCARIGARGIGCSPPALKVLSVASNRVGLRVHWEIESASSVESWIERADQAAGPWDSLGTGATSATHGRELLDAAVAPDRAYHYRVSWMDRGAVVHGAPVMGTWIDAGRLSSATPNPALNDVKVEWVLAQPGRTDIHIFDLAGREVSVVAKGTYGVGRHQAQWNGQWQGRGPAPAGMYIVRISSADRTTSHRVMLVR